MDTKLSAYLAVALLASALTACGQDRDTDRTTNEPQTTTPATPPPATPPASGDGASTSGSMPPECDFSDHDTSQMSGEEHRRMMEQCEAAKRRGNNTGMEGSPSGSGTSPNSPTTTPSTTPSTPPSNAPQQ